RMSERTLPGLHSRSPGIPEDSQVGYEVGAGTPSRGPRSEAQDLGVPFHVHEAVAAHVEGDDLPFGRLLAWHCLDDGAGDAVGALRGGQESLGLDELSGPFEHIPFVLRVRDRVDEAAMPEEGEDR